jgi:hypothetical protein
VAGGILVELSVSLVSVFSVSSVLGAGVEVEAGGGEVAVVVWSGEDGVITGSRTDDIFVDWVWCNCCMMLSSFAVCRATSKPLLI